MWDLATCAGGELNVVPVAFKDVTEDGKLLEGYQIKGTAQYLTEGEIVNTFKAMVQKLSLHRGHARGEGQRPLLRQARLPGDGKRRGDSNLRLQR